MGRRRKEESLWVLAIKGRWPLSAGLALGCLFFSYVLVPVFLTGNPFLHIVASAFRPLGTVLGGIFGVIALFKFFAQAGVSQKLDRFPHLIRLEQDSAEPDPSRNTSVVDAAWDASFKRRVEPSSQPDRWTLELLQSIEWKKFEELSTAYYQEKGIRAEATSLGADGGIDIHLYQEASDHVTAIVQCKAWNNRLVGVKEIREFLGVMAHEKIPKGFYMASGGFSEEAKAIARVNRITLVTGELLLAMIQRLPDDAQHRLLALATEGDYTTPSCPSCGTKMISRSGKRGSFWGCRSYPKCRQVIHARQRRA